MADKVTGKGVIAGIAIGKILLAGQNLDSYLVSYKPGKLDAEKKKAALKAARAVFICVILS